MRGRRVVITGVGIIASAGADKESFAKTIVSGVRALFPINDKRIAHFNAKYAGLVTENIDIHPSLDRSVFAGSDRFVKLAAIAAKQAAEDALVNESLNSVKAGLFLGTCSGPMLTIEEQYQRELDGTARFDVEDLFARQYYSGAVYLARYFGIKGSVCTVTTACSAFTAAVASATDYIRTGTLDIALVGGADSFSTTTLAGFAGLKATHDDMCAPFSVPPGLNLGEGAGFVVLESFDHADARSVQIKGEILGVGLSNDAYHSSAPDPNGKGAIQSMQNAIDESKISIDEISYVSAHGTGTAANDKAETKALNRVFGDKAKYVPVSSLKGITGHCLGAAGAVETIAALLCAEREVHPPGTGFTEARDGCTLDYIPDAGRKWKKEAVFVKNNFAFGGNNASVVIGTGCKKWGSERVLSDDPVCITGSGVASAAGIGTSLSAFDLSGITKPIEKKIRGRGTFSCMESVSINAGSIDRRIDPRSERSAQLCAVAVVKALTSAGIPERQAAHMNLGLFMNIAQGSTFTEEEHIVSLLKNNYELNQVNAFPYIVPNSVTGTVCRMLSLTGHNATFCNGPGASLTGLGLAWNAVRNDHVSMLLCGSVDDLSVRGTLDCLLAEQIELAKTLPGDGAAMLLLEKLSHAKERGVSPLCIIRSVVTRYTENQQKVDCYCDMIAQALAEARVLPQQVAVVSYNTWSADAVLAVRTVMGSNAYNIVDCTGSTGYAPASLPFFNISAALDNRFFEVICEKKYILTFFNARHACDCVAVFEKVF